MTPKTHPGAQQQSEGPTPRYRVGGGDEIGDTTSPYLSSAFDVRLWQVSWQCQRHQLTALLWHFATTYIGYTCALWMHVSVCLSVVFAGDNPRLLSPIKISFCSPWDGQRQPKAMKRKHDQGARFGFKFRLVGSLVWIDKFINPMQSQENSMQEINEVL